MVFLDFEYCTAISIPLLDSSDTWTGSPVLRSLHLNMKTAYDYEKLLSACPNLRRFTSNSPSWIDPTKGTFTFLLLTLDKNIYYIQRKLFDNFERIEKTNYFLSVMKFYLQI